MAKAILRLVKLKGQGSISGSSAHVFRERETPNANPNADKPNVYLGAKNSTDLKTAIDARIATATNKVIRSTAVPLVEFLITASPDFFQQSDIYRKKFFKQSYEFFKEEFGAKNVVSFVVHFDELTPHAHVYVVPMDPENKLNAKHYFGGRVKLRQLQTDYAACVADLGLERGVEGSKATHKTVKAHYASLRSEAEYKAMQADLDAKKAVLAAESARVDALKKTLEALGSDLANQVNDANVRLIPLESVLKKTGAIKRGDSWISTIGAIDIKNGTYRLEDGKLKKNSIDLVIDLFGCKYNDAILWLKQNFNKDSIVNTAKKRTEDKVLSLLETDLQVQLELKKKIIVEEEIKKESQIKHSPIKRTIFGGNDYSM